MIEQKLKKLTERVYYLPTDHHTDRPVLGVVVGDTHTLVVDAGNSPYHVQMLMQEIEKYGIPVPTLLFLTHWHWDHTFGLSAYSIPAIAHRKTYEHLLRLKEYEWTDEALDQRVQEGIEIAFCADMIKVEFGTKREDIQIALPSILIDHSLKLDLGNVTCHIEHVGGDHAEDSTILVVEQEGVVFLGDSATPDIYSTKRKYTTELLIPMLDRLESFQADYYLYSHSEPMTREAFFQENRESRAIAESLHKHGLDLDRIAQDVEPVFGRPLTSDDKEFIQYFINGCE